MKKTGIWICVAVLLVLGGGGIYALGSRSEAPVSSSVQPFTFTDSAGEEVTVSSTERVVCLYGSYAEAWLSAGGTLAGATEDAVTERGLGLEDSVIVGTVQNPNLEQIISKDPTFVILSTDISGHQAILDNLKELEIPAASFTVDSFSQYESMMSVFLSLTGREDLRQSLVTDVKTQIDAVVDAARSREEAPTVLLLRAYSSGVTAKSDDTVAGVILKELGAVNIADKYPSLLSDLSVEIILQEDPDFIFVTTMGTSEEAALASLEYLIEENPAWNSLSAVQSDRSIVLEKALYHYKPNARWGESYETLYHYLYEAA
ncbi:MAG: ABC transporter substrate-binding protein [Clostridiales bacterium]|nr:ABC transporter substrate-binding protein [Clostridiales bacterium]